MALLLTHSYIISISGIIVLRLNSALTAAHGDTCSPHAERRRNAANTPVHIRQKNAPTLTSHILTVGNHIEPGRSRNAIHIRAMQKAL